MLSAAGVLLDESHAARKERRSNARAYTHSEAILTQLWRGVIFFCFPSYVVSHGLCVLFSGLATKQPFVLYPRQNKGRTGSSGRRRGPGMQVHFLTFLLSVGGMCHVDQTWSRDVLLW